MTLSESAILWLLGVLLGLVGALVWAIYKAVLKAQDKHDERITNNENDLAIIDKELATTIQKHHDDHASVCERLNAMDSKIKGQGDFFNQRFNELKQRRQR